MKLRFIIILGLVAVTALAYGGWRTWCAHMDWVTLNVRNMDVRQAVKKIERQTWETVLVHTNVQGKITLNVRRAALDDVLRIVAQQTSSRSEQLYPLYGKSRSLETLKRGLLGSVDPLDHGWTNLQVRGFLRVGPGGPLGMQNESGSKKISLQIVNKELSFTAMALNRFGQLRVVPEDGVFPLVSLNLHEASPEKTVKILAKKVDRKWTKLYALRREFGPGGPEGLVFAGGQHNPSARSEVSQAVTGAVSRPRGEFNSERFEEMRTRQRALEAELVSALPAKEQAKLQQAQQEREKQFQEMQNLTPEERQARFAQMGGRMDRMNRERLKNSTQQQRVEQTRRILEMRARMQRHPQTTPTGR